MISWSQEVLFQCWLGENSLLSPLFFFFSVLGLAQNLSLLSWLSGAKMRLAAKSDDNIIIVETSLADKPAESDHSGSDKTVVPCISASDQSETSEASDLKSTQNQNRGLKCSHFSTEWEGLFASQFADVNQEKSHVSAELQQEDVDYFWGLVIWLLWGSSCGASYLRLYKGRQVQEIVRWLK